MFKRVFSINVLTDWIAIEENKILSFTLHYTENEFFVGYRPKIKKQKQLNRVSLT